MKTEIISILDRSGSMASIVGDAIGGFNTFLAEQKNVPGEARMTLVLFDNLFECAYAGKPIAEVEPLDSATYTPRGGTALMDAIGRTLNEQGARIKREGWADKVIICILTDGEENSSREFDRGRIQAMVKHAESHGWSFVFLAANQDAFQAANKYGISAAHTAQFSADSIGTQSAYRSMSSMTASLRVQP